MTSKQTGPRLPLNQCSPGALRNQFTLAGGGTGGAGHLSAASGTVSPATTSGTGSPENTPLVGGPQSQLLNEQRQHKGGHNKRHATYEN